MVFLYSMNVPSVERLAKCKSLLDALLSLSRSMMKPNQNQINQIKSQWRVAVWGLHKLLPYRSSGICSPTPPDHIPLAPPPLFHTVGVLGPLQQHVEDANHEQRNAEQRRHQRRRGAIIVAVVVAVHVLVGEAGQVVLELGLEVVERGHDEVDDLVAVDLDVRDVHGRVDIEDARAAEVVALVAVGDDAGADDVAAL